MKQKEIINEYCYPAKDVAIRFHLDGKEIFKRNNISLEHINKELTDKDLKTHEIYRTMEDKAGNFLFCYDIDNHDYTEWNETPELGIYYLLQKAKKLESFLGNILSWKFTGRGLQGCAIIIPHELIDEKFKNIYYFGRKICNYFDRVTNLKSDTQILHKAGLTRSIGSINLKSNMYCIPIDLNWTAKKIIKKSKVCDVESKYFKTNLLRIGYWLNKLQAFKPVNLQKYARKGTDKCLFLDSALNTLLPKGKRHSIISKNMAIYTFSKLDREHLRKKYLTAQKAERDSELEFKGWDSKIERDEMKEIWCHELIKFQKEYNIDLKCLDCKFFKENKL